MEEDRGQSLRTRARRAPRYRTVAEALRRQVDDGLLAAGVKLPALQELAEQFKVSTHTVRCAIRVLEQEGCTYRVPAVGAFVRPGGGLSSAKQTVVALITFDIGGAFELGIARGIEQACRDRGWELQIYDSRSDPQAEVRSVQRLCQKNSGVRGAIILPAGREENMESLFKLKLTGVPIVLLDRAITGLRVDLVESDHEKGAYLATRHFLDRGHSHVYMVTEPPVVSSIVSRIRGYEKAHRELSIEPKAEWMIWVDLEMSARGVREEHRWFGGYHAVLPVLRDLKPPAAFFAMNDYIAWGLCKACQEVGLRVPQDVSVICFDDSDITRAMTPPLTVVAQRAGDLGQKSVEMLERRVQAAGADVKPELVRVDVELIERQSVAMLSKG